MTFCKTTARNALLALSLFSSVSAAPTVGVTQIVDHPSLDAIRRGVLEALKAQYPDMEIVYENAQGNPTIATQIAQKFQGMPLDAIVAITTPSAQTMASRVTETPIIFTAVSDPLAAKVVTDLKKPAGNVTGVMDANPVEEQLDFIQNQMPDLKRLGYLYNPGEVNSVVVLEALQKLAPARGLILVPLAVNKTADMSMVAASMPGRIDALFIGNDNMVVSALEPVVKITQSHNIPFFTSDPDSVERGALASYAYAQKDIGIQAGEMTVRVLKGEKPGDIPVERARHLEVTRNEKTAQVIGFVFKGEKK